MRNAVIRHFFNGSGPDRIITIGGDADILGVQNPSSPGTFHRVSEWSDDACQTITLGHRECVKVKFKQTEETYESTIRRGKLRVATGAGNVRVENSSTEEFVDLRFRVGGPKDETQIIFIDYFENEKRASKLKQKHGICVNRQGKDTRIRGGKEVLGDIAFIDPST